MTTARQTIQSDPKRLVDEALTEQIIGAAIEVHRHLGPGLLESAYEECLCHELQLRGLTFKRQVNLPGVYKGVSLDRGYKMDLVVEDRIAIELKCVESVLGVHHAQLLTYLTLSGKRVGLIFNFHVSSYDERCCSQSVMTLPSLSPCLCVSVVKTQ